MDITLVAPPHFMPHSALNISFSLYNELISYADIILSLRSQTESHNKIFYGSLKDYANDFCIKVDLVQDKKLILLHPGPGHRNIEISDEMMDEERSLVLKHVNNGVAIRMAVLKK